MISYKPFWNTLKTKGVSTYALREKHKISPGILTSMKENRYISLSTVDQLCKILDCRIDEIAEYIPDTN